MGSNPDAAVYFSNDVPRADTRNSLQFAMSGTTSLSIARSILPCVRRPSLPEYTAAVPETHDAPPSATNRRGESLGCMD